MSFDKNKRSKNKLIRICVILSVLLVFAIVCTIYLNDYYHADMDAIEGYYIESHVEKQVLQDDTIIYMPQNPDVGFIYYPGGKVEYLAYEPLMKTLASEGVLCILIEMPFNLAVFDANAADGLQDMYPDIDKWYIGGHSLGGSMAASYLSENVEDFDGMILLGSYSTADLSEEAVAVLSIYGSEDLVLNKKNYEENKLNLPDNFTEVVIDGGCHAYFGMYGAQDGDGIPTITNEEQIQITAENILEFIEKEQ